MKRLITFIYAVAILTLLATPVLAVPTIDYFNIDFWQGNFDSGTGTGYNGSWYYYDNTGWYNQWFYDAPPDPERYKEITYDITVDSLPDPTWPNASHVKIALNWSTLAYPESGPDGPPPLPQLFDTPYEWLEDVFIAREVIFDGLINFWITEHIVGTFTIPDYNPEWVSIDIWLEGIPVYYIGLVTSNASVMGITSVTGTITHECIPAPGAVLLGSIGVGLVGWMRRRRAI